MLSRARGPPASIPASPVFISYYIAPLKFRCECHAVYQEMLDRTQPSWYTCSSIERRSSRMKKSTTPTFLLELPLAVTGGQAKHLRAHFEAARALYNTLLGEALARLHRMWADPAWQAARAIPRSLKQERAAAFSQLRQEYGFSEYALPDYAKPATSTSIPYHINPVTTQT